MPFDLFLLHDPNEDKTVRHLLRVYTETHKDRSNGFSQAREQALRLHHLFSAADAQVRKTRSKNWWFEWVLETGFKFKESGISEWFYGRSSIPLIAVKNLQHFLPPEEFSQIKEDVGFICTTTKGAFRIPKELTTDLAYLAGAILCDGHLKKHNYCICIELTNETIMQRFQEKLLNAFGLAIKYSKINRSGKSTSYYLQVDSKPISRFFTIFFGIPRGKKSHVIKVPTCIKQSSAEIKLAFIYGVFDTDGGKRHRGFGLTSASSSS